MAHDSYGNAAVMVKVYSGTVTYNIGDQNLSTITVRKDAACTLGCVLVCACAHMPACVMGQGDFSLSPGFYI